MADFLYNGVQLPELPEVEGFPYKYAYYHKLNCNQYEVVCSAEPLVANTDVGGYGNCVIAMLMNDKAKLYYLTGGTWSKSGLGYKPIYKGDVSFQWTNYDIFFTGGTDIYLAKSPDPVSVIPPLDPTALLMGWQVGNRIRGGA